VEVERLIDEVREGDVKSEDSVYSGVFRPYGGDSDMMRVIL
jgi:hypothetical protein